MFAPRLPVADGHDNRLVTLCDAEVAPEHGTPFRLGLVVVTDGRRIVVGFNGWRLQWELPVGIVREGETLRAAVAREADYATRLDHDQSMLRYVGSAEFVLGATGDQRSSAIFTATVDPGAAPALDDDSTGYRWHDLELGGASATSPSETIARWALSAHR